MKSTERAFAALFGALLLGVGIYAVLYGATGTIWGYIGGAVFAVLGGNALYAAVTNRRPWIFRIGPLP